MKKSSFSTNTFLSDRSMVLVNITCVVLSTHWMSSEDSSRTITEHHAITPHCTRVPVVVVQEEVDEEGRVGCEEERFVGAGHNKTHVDVATLHTSTMTGE